jgi:electron transfer flavoprotein alpha subunit
MASLEKLAGLIGGVLGGSRPTVMDGWLKQHQIIGMSGHSVHPRLCIVFGASGMMPLVKGVEKSETVIAVNSDRNALIFKVSDVGVHADLHTVVETLIRIIESARRKTNP